MQTKNEVKAGDVFGRLTLTGEVLYKDCSDGYKRLMHVAKCECGVIKAYLLKYLLRGDTKSCGCHRKQTLLECRTSHNLASHPLYSVFQDMKRRCYEKRCKAYPDYGGRGIIVEEIWLTDIKAFVDWGMANGYEKGLELDRINNDGNYGPSNCRFVTRAIGNTNTRRNVIISCFGETKTITDWSRDKRCKVNISTLIGRYRTGKWDFEKAMNTLASEDHKKIQRNSSSARQISAWNEIKSIIEWSEDARCKIGYSGLKIRLKKGMTPEQAMSLSFRG